ncbi:hypothetical protein [Nesterenkonia ebinurensis]|uniref:hypothetical protein n=1 Tax=Nesterenkonia ebinurensis TaxID=2608252 RepID=UPI00123DA3E0|nr:hypothetical protein [Nesterenkonia ebinurensis]
MSLLLWSAIALVLLPAYTSYRSWASTPPKRSSPKWRPWFERQAGLPMPEDLQQPVIDRITNHERWARVGGLAGWTAGAVFLLVVGRQNDLGMLVLSTLILGTMLGGVLAVINGKHQLSPDAPRYARAEAVSLADYVPRGELITVRLAPAAALVLAGAAVVILQVAPLELPETLDWVSWMWILWVTAGLTLAAWAGFELVARHVLNQPQHAGSELELAWDDHCRSEAIRNFQGLPMFLVLLTGLSALAAVGLVTTNSEVREGAMGETLATGFTMLLVFGAVTAVVLVPAISAALRKPRQHVLRRLWAGHGFGTVPAQEQP